MKLRLALLIGIFFLLLALVEGIWKVYSPFEKMLLENIITPSVSPSIDSAPVQSVSGNIPVDTPSTDAVLILPFRISGKAKVFENQLNYRVRDFDGSFYTKGKE